VVGRRFFYRGSGKFPHAAAPVEPVPPEIAIYFISTTIRGDVTLGPRDKKKRDAAADGPAFAPVGDRTTIDCGSRKRKLK